MNDRVAEARQKVDQMQQAGDIYFTGRAETLKGIQDPQLQDRARQRSRTARTLCRRTSVSP